MKTTDFRRYTGTCIVKILRNSPCFKNKLFFLCRNLFCKKCFYIVNNVKTLLTEQISAKKEELVLKAGAVPQDFDYTCPGISPKIGGLHPITQMRYDLDDAFRSMGFEIFQGPEITSEYYAFDNLNFPPNHPARESMDTYWLSGHDSGSASDKLCLRPHLTGDSVRYMQTHKPPYRFVYPGRVYRNETTDARHVKDYIAIFGPEGFPSGPFHAPASNCSLSLRCAPYPKGSL